MWVIFWSCVTIFLLRGTTFHGILIGWWHGICILMRLVERWRRRRVIAAHWVHGVHKTGWGLHWKGWASGWGWAPWGGAHAFRLLILLVLHAAVLEPDLDLPFTKVEKIGHLYASRPTQVPIEMELLLKFHKLCARVGCARSLGSRGTRRAFLAATALRWVGNEIKHNYYKRQLNASFPLIKQATKNFTPWYWLSTLHNWHLLIEACPNTDRVYVNCIMTKSPRPVVPCGKLDHIWCLSCRATALLCEDITRTYAVTRPKYNFRNLCTIGPEK